MTNHNRPTSEWEFSHALQEGDRLHDTSRDTNGLVDKVWGDGSIVVLWQDGKETHTEEEITKALANSDIERDDGLSHELATF